MLRLSPSNVIAVAGTSYNCIALPEGCLLQVAAANNYTTPGQRVVIYLSTRPLNNAAVNAPTDILESSLPLVTGTQAGINEPVIFRHEGLRIPMDFRTLVAVYWNCLAGDTLYLRAGVDL